MLLFLQVNHHTMTPPEQIEGKKEDTLYTYYQVDVENMPLEWNTTICESLDEVRKILQYVDIHLDDPTIEARVIIRGIGMTQVAFKQWQEENLEQ
jgi:hypothetical protein